MLFEWTDPEFAPDQFPDGEGQLPIAGSVDCCVGLCPGSLHVLPGHVAEQFLRRIVLRINVRGYLGYFFGLRAARITDSGA